MSHWLYISPHLDDVVLSCGGSIYQKAEKGDSVTILTVFTSPGKNCQSEINHKYQRRINSDFLAGKILGFNSIHLGYIDAPFRSKIFNSFHSIMFTGLNEYSDRSLIAELVNKLEVMISSQIMPENILFPLGIGGHIDHQIVYEASKAINKKAKVSYYEERPYSFMPGSVAYRWSNLCNKKEYTSTSDCSSEDLKLWENIKLPFLNNYMVNKNDKVMSLKELKRRHITLSKKSTSCEIWDMDCDKWYRKYVFLKDADVNKLVNAILCYTTEIGDLFDCYEDMPDREKISVVKNIYEDNIFRSGKNIWHEAIWVYDDN